MPSGTRYCPGTWPHGVAAQNAQAKRIHACGIPEIVAERVSRVSGQADWRTIRVPPGRLRTGRWMA